MRGMRAGIWVRMERWRAWNGRDGDSGCFDVSRGADCVDGVGGVERVGLGLRRGFRRLESEWME
jgi:hypothetical protein